MPELLRNGVLTKPATLTHEIAEHLKNRIIYGEFCPGDRLTILKLCSEYDVSQAVIREALAKLEASMLIVFLPRKGCYVRSMNRTEIEDLWQLIARFWSYTARAFCRNHVCDPDAIKTLSDLFASYKLAIEQNNADDRIKFGHQLLLTLDIDCKSSLLQQVLNTFEPQVRRIRWIEAKHERRADLSSDKQLEMYQSILDNDPARAESTFFEVLIKEKDFILSIMEDEI